MCACAGWPARNTEQITNIDLLPPLISLYIESKSSNEYKLKIRFSCSKWTLNIIRNRIQYIGLEHNDFYILSLIRSQAKKEFKITKWRRREKNALIQFSWNSIKKYVFCFVFCPKSIMNVYNVRANRRVEIFFFKGWPLWSSFPIFLTLSCN